MSEAGEGGGGAAASAETHVCVARGEVPGEPADGAGRGSPRVFVTCSSLFLQKAGRAILHNPTYRFRALPSKCPVAVFTEIEQQPKICAEAQKILDSEILGKRSNAVPRTVWWQPENRHTDQRSRPESPQMNPPPSGQVITTKEA